MLNASNLYAFIHWCNILENWTGYKKVEYLARYIYIHIYVYMCIYTYITVCMIDNCMFGVLCFSWNH